jgi:hypothetical protein
MRMRLAFEELYEALGKPTPEFPKYTTQLMNLAHLGQDAQAIRDDL